MVERVKSIIGCLKQCFNETYPVTQVTAKKMPTSKHTSRKQPRFSNSKKKKSESMGVTYVLFTKQSATPKWKYDSNREEKSLLLPPRQINILKPNYQKYSTSLTPCTINNRGINYYTYSQ